MTTTTTTTTGKPSRKRSKRRKMLKVRQKPDINGSSEPAVPPSQRTPGVRSKDKMTPAEWRGAYDIRIREMLDALGATHAELGAAVTKPSGAPLGRTAITNWLRGTQPNIMQFNQVAEFANNHPNKDNLPPEKRTAAWFAYGITHKPVTVYPDTDELGYNLISEVTVEGPARRNRKQVRQWGIGTDFLTTELGAAPKDAIIVKSNEDSQGIEYGDRMLVDCGEQATAPSPPGKFLIWDGYAATAASISLLPPIQGSRKVRAKVVTAAGTSEVDPEKVEIIGRVRGVWKKV